MSTTWIEICDDEGSRKTFQPSDVRRVTIHDTPDFLVKDCKPKSFVNIVLTDGRETGHYSMTFTERARAESAYNTVRIAIGLATP